MKGKVLLFLFALPFFGVGVWMLWSISDDFIEASGMRDWQAADARVVEAGYHTHTGDDSDTYEAYATYVYQYQGRQYTGNRVTITGGADNVGEYQRSTGRRLSRAWSEQRPITIYFDPQNPDDSIVDRSIRWGLVGFKSIFVFAFGGAGLGMIIWAIRAPRKKDASDPKYADKPWTMNDNWLTPTIKSNSKQTMYFTWGFAAFWNLISAPLPFLMYREVVDNRNYAALFGLLFTLIGIWLIIWAVKNTREWKTFGPAPVTLDPYPGSIGGHVGGTIDINMPYDPSVKITLTLTNIYSYESGSGKNRSRNERAKWQDKQVAHLDAGPRGTRVSFRFDVPADLDESDADQSSDDYYIWRLNLKADLPGTDIDRDYEIPVYATAEESRHISHRAIEEARHQTDAIDDKAVRESIQIHSGIHGKEMVYPMGRNLGSSFIGFLVGAIFTGAGWWLVVREGERLFGTVFGAIGALVAIACLYVVLNSLHVTRSASEITAVRKLLGIPIRTQRMRIDQIVRLSKKSKHKSQSGNKHTVYFSIYARDRDGNKMVVGEGFKGNNEAKAAIRFLTKEFGITPAKAASDLNDIDFDVLAADN
jgi:hypothetical protein